jgi:hypothetical protein
MSLPALNVTYGAAKLFVIQADVGYGLAKLLKSLSPPLLSMNATWSKIVAPLKYITSPTILP